MTAAPLARSNEVLCGEPHKTSFERAMLRERTKAGLGLESAARDALAAADPNVRVWPSG